VELTVAEEIDAGIGGKTHSRVHTPTNFVDGDGGIGIIAPEELLITPVPPLQPMTQQSAKGAVMTTPLYKTQQSTEGAVMNAPLYQPRYAQTLFTPDVTTRTLQQLYQHRDYAALGLGTVVAQQQHAAQQPGLVPAQQQHAAQQPSLVPAQQQPAQPTTQQSAKKKVKKISESSLSNEKTKKSLFERRGSIAKLASSIAKDEANWMSMFMVMQIQQQQLSAAVAISTGSPSERG
jgi:hypothetical protein